MTNRFLISVAAAALIAGTGFANAQGTGMSREGGAAGGATAQKSAPSERGSPSAAPMNRDGGESKGMKGAQSKEKENMKGAQSKEKMAPEGSKKNQRVQDDTKAGAKREKSAQDKNVKGEKSKSMSSETTTDKGAPSKGMKAETKGGAADKSQTTTQSRPGAGGAADTKSQTTTESQSGKSTTTTGQAGAAAKLSTEQRTQITSVIKEQRVAPLTNVNFSISIGTRVPRTVSFHTLPSRVVTIYPEWRGYKFVLVREQILVIDPDTYEIVAVLEA
jgi:hypothetical protein